MSRRSRPEPRRLRRFVWGRTRLLVPLAVSSLVVWIALLTGLAAVGSTPGTAASSGQPPALTTPPVWAVPGGTASAVPVPTARPTATPSPTPLITPAPPEPAPPAAPTSADGFQARGTVVPIAFPLPEDVRYSYHDDWLAVRVGAVYRYNNVATVLPDGRLVRAHDGVDIHVREGVAVLAPFSGAVIDPGSRWRPWDLARSGEVVAIVSDEPASRGYAALLLHLSAVQVRPGDRVLRGETVGLTGTTGNAAGLAPHLHFELRAPFLLALREGRLIRRVDAFDPYPSLLAADFRATNERGQPGVPSYRWKEL